MNEELKQYYEADLREHAQGYQSGSSEYRAMRERDKHRRQRVTELIALKQLQTAEDFHHAARIFQHGDMPEDAWNAYQCALRSVNEGYRPARWLAAAAYDRWLMYQGKPQKYGTQYVSDGKRQQLWDVDPATTDEERANWDVPPLAEQHQKAEEATRLHPPIPVLEDAPKWLKEAIQRWEVGGG